MLASLNQLSAIPSILRARPYATRGQLLAYQNVRLRRLVAHAYENVPYYRRLFDEHRVEPARVLTAGDLVALPVTSRRDLQSADDAEIVARGVDRAALISRPTSGASGEPLVVRRTWSEERLLNSLRRRAMGEYGLRARDKVAYVTLKRSPDARDHQLPLRLFQSAGFYRRSVIDCLLPPEEVVESLGRFKPDVLVGYAGVLARVAETIGRGGAGSIRPRFVVAGAEVLTAEMRERVEGAFGVPVYDVYGSHEFNLLAWQCKASSSFHTCDDGVIVEVLKDGRPARPGERGEVVATGLHSFAMPLIRYRLGDVVTKGEGACGCGQPFSTVESIQGRAYESFALPGRPPVYSFELWSAVRAAASWVSVYQLAEERPRRFVLRVVPRVTPSEGERAALAEALRAALGPGVESEVRLVGEIPAGAAGKLRAFVTPDGPAADRSDGEKPAPF